MLNGIINVYKEAGYTSHDVVAKLRGICMQKKIGHTGTLDPAATGVLPVCLGRGTKLCDMLTDKDKEYEAELLLGVTTDTQDMTGTILTQSPVTVTQQQVIDVISNFIGDYMQIPPMYSALKIDGKKLYELARAGKEVERKSRLVFIRNIEILEMELPVVRMKVTCSKGTYIRTLCQDIGEKLQCGGVMKSLIRTRVGRFHLEEALTLSQLEKLKEQQRLQEAILPVEAMFLDNPSLHVKDEFRKNIQNGNAFFPSQTLENIICEEDVWVKVYISDNDFAGIYTYNAEREWYKPVKMFLE